MANFNVATMELRKGLNLMHHENTKISVIGLGYVGLPVAVAFSKRNFEVIGFDINKLRIKKLQEGVDETGEIKFEELVKSKILFTSNDKHLAKANFHIIAVPTPIDEYKNPDLSLVENACKIVGKILKKNDIVIIESTVYPGVTEEIAVPIIEESSGLKLNVDFSIGYSPERINPADKINTFENIKKVISASNDKALFKMNQIYGSVVKAGIYNAPSIKVAEAAKVIENTQRDLNIAFMNELVKIFDALNINTHEVLNAASTKWNFLPFQPGFVGGHCIGVDPYYLIHKSQQAGVIPDLLLSVRKINDEMSKYFAQKILNILVEKDLNFNKSNILLLGLTFKENCPDIRNSKIVDLINELKHFKIKLDIFDPIVNSKEAKEKLGFKVKLKPDKGKYDLVIITVPHQAFKDLGVKKIKSWCKKNGSLMDLKNTFPQNTVDYSI